MRATMAQKDRMEMIYRRTILVLAAFCVVVLVSIAALLVNYETGSFTRGFEEGFNLEGTYQVSEGSMTTISFGFTDMESREGLWQLAKVSDQEVVNGYFEPTHDPNMFTLLDKGRKAAGGRTSLTLRISRDGPVACCMCSMAMSLIERKRKVMASPTTIKIPMA